MFKWLSRKKCLRHRFFSTVPLKITDYVKHANSHQQFEINAVYFQHSLNKDIDGNDMIADKNYNVGLCVFDKTSNLTSFENSENRYWKTGKLK